MSVEPLELVRLATHTFQKLGVPHLLVGSLASSLHGEPRATRAVDFVAQLSFDQVDAFVAALGSGFYADADMIRAAVRRRAGFNVVHLESLFKVDIFAPADAEQFRRELQLSVGLPLPGHPGAEVRVTGAEDTILAKLAWYRAGGEVSDQQWRDVIGVLCIQRETLARDYLDSEARARGLDGLLARALTDAEVR